jgi:pimeloyl-ACP methyl ester carboxylesterase
MVLPDSDDVDADAALAALFRGCAAETACAKAHPSLAQSWTSLLASLPKAVDFVGPVSGEPRHVTMTRGALRSLVRPALYQPTLGALLPYAIAQAAAGRYEPLMALAAGDVDLSEGEHFSVICAEDAPRMSPVDRADGDHEAQAMYRAACASWPRGDVPAAFYTIPRSPAPVLLLSGGLDPVTPPRHAERVARALGPMARSVVVANNGHNVMAIACMRDAVFHFINAATDAEAQAVDMGCAAKVPRPLAFQPPLTARARAADNDPNRFDDSAPHTPDAPPPGMKDAR